MRLEIIGHNYQYEMEKLTRLFFPNEQIHVVFETETRQNGEAFFTTVITETTATAAYYEETGVCLYKEEAELSSEADAELLIASLLFKVLKSMTDYTPKWGVLTGIRPSKLLLRLEETMGEEGAERYFLDKFFVSEEKTALAKSVARREDAIIQTSRPDSFSLYVSIPFCPTRCSYCSFISSAMTGKTIQKMLPEYVEYLVKEIEYTGKQAKALGLRLETVYFGGGTPTTLSAEQITQLLDAIAASFDLSHLREYTVEAGRPDTITREKLEALKAGGVTRISINPQTFNDDVLKEVGRCHSADLTKEVYTMAKSFGFHAINMDLIAGLPTDTLESFCQSVDTAIALDPENITVHTLSLKRSSNLGTEKERIEFERGICADQMLHYAYARLTENGYGPYYMYRQAKTLGNLENTGYAKSGTDCLYNIFMMEECHTVLAVGAGAVTKLKAPHGKEIERIFNYKYPYEYIRGFDALLKRKARLPEFYKEFKI